MKLKIKKLHEDAVLPIAANPGDAGLDLVSVSDGVMKAAEGDNPLWYYVEYKTGLAIQLPEGHVGLLFPRSSISKYALSLCNSVGVLDESYRGEISLRFRLDAGTVKESEESKKIPSIYKKGDKIGQLVVIPYPKMEPEFVDSLDETVRGVGGFGSSDTPKV